MKKIQNYTLIEDRYIDSEQSHVYVYEHDITKAKILVMKNLDDNKLFSVGFRTPPANSTGVCHILEHCVLNGSKKYRTREPFMDMVKSSLQTFLNAMTYQDKTIYPVASRNLKDFENLMDLYLDAVFNPRVLEKKEIFLQEGWRYDLDDSGTITYKGVVYNEMKGAMSTAEDQVVSQIYEHLFPDTIYSFNSGGDPYEIPNLSYEEFIDYYKEYYHPSNSYIFLYGNTDYEKYLQYIHEEYLSNYDFRFVDSKITLQEKFDQKKYLEEKFSTDKKIEEASNMVSYSIISANCDTSYDRIMNKLLRSVLIGSESSPIKAAINELEIVDDILNTSSSDRQITFSILGKNIKEKDVELFVSTIEGVLQRIVKEGIDKDLVNSMLNNLFFSLKEKNDNPTKGIEYLDRAYSTWLYDLSPLDGLDDSKSLEYIKENIENGIFEKYIQEHLLDNTHKLVILHRPEFGLNEKKDSEIKAKLAEMYIDLTDKEKTSLINQREEMEVFQNAEDSQADKDTIPKLDLSDVNTKFIPIDRKIEKKDGYTVLSHNLPTSGIDYINFVFNVNHIPQEDTLYLSMLADILGLIDTKSYGYMDLFNKIYLETGGISFNVGNHIVRDSMKMNRTFTISTKAFSDNIENAFEILSEILFNTNFENEKRFKELINIIKSRSEMGLLDYAHILMMNRVNASKFESNDFMEKVNGIDSYLFYKNLNFEDIPSIFGKLKEIYSKIFNKNNLVINLTSDFTNKEQLYNALNKLIDKLSSEKVTEIPYMFKPSIRKEALIASTDVSYVSIGNNMKLYDYEYSGSSTVISNLLSNAYLYNEIRAKGGAYGAGMSINNKNAFVTYSYRDPNITNTINTYNKLPEIMKSINIDEQELKSFIIGAVGKFDPPLTEKGKGRKDLEMYLSGISYEEVEKYVEEALKTSTDDIQRLVAPINKSIEESSLSVLTNESKYKEVKDFFTSKISLI